MSPFDIAPKLSNIIGHYPDPITVKQLVEDQVSHYDRMFVRLWLAEGIPHAFHNCPSLYQVTREWLARKLEVSPEDITIVGSARLGYSLKPSCFSRAFNSRSDLDYVVISEPLFLKCQEASMLFVADYESSFITPTSDAQRQEWAGDVAFIKRNTLKGFLNSGKVPNWKRYEAMRSMENHFWHLGAKIKLTRGSPEFSKATFRIYRDYDSFIKRASINLSYALQSV